MPLEPRSYFCAGRHLSAETSEDVNLAIYFTEGSSVPDSCPNCQHDLQEFKLTLPTLHRSNVTCPRCGAIALQQRVVCNWDLTPIMEYVPYDGQTYIVTCPNCGNISRVSWPPGIDYGPPGLPPDGYDPADYVQSYTP